MDNSQVASCQNFLMSIQSASNLDLYFSPWESHYVYKGKTILKFNEQEDTSKKPLLNLTVCLCSKWLREGNELIQGERLCLPALSLTSGGSNDCSSSCLLFQGNS